MRRAPQRHRAVLPPRRVLKTEASFLAGTAKSQVDWTGPQSLPDGRIGELGTPVVTEMSPQCHFFDFALIRPSNIRNMLEE